MLTIFRGRVPIGRVTVPMAHVRYRKIYTAGWHVPKTATPGKLAWCAIAVDEAGNTSKRSCSSLRIA